MRERLNSRHHLPSEHERCDCRCTVLEIYLTRRRFASLHLCRSINDSVGACNLQKRHIEHQHHSGNINGIVLQCRGTNLDPSAVVNTCFNLGFQLSGCTNPARIQAPLASVVVTISANAGSASVLSLYGAQFTFPRIVVGNALQISKTFQFIYFIRNYRSCYHCTSSHHILNDAPQLHRYR